MTCSAIPLTAKYKTAMIAVITTAISIAEPNFFGNFTFFSRYSITGCAIIDMIQPATNGHKNASVLGNTKIKSNAPASITSNSMIISR